ncbi:ABC transporter substrate-binding protein [Limibaculum sp. M0105]|uniref:ABC transporter substrate-binding protein n=1 Tax=Thermohalobaculum xanthum TaxID=2753746 RepID=A0A8J7M4R3_9RHOB|nr:ABC transporter substrate-binding protein [Thermohalobaculum xanthum]MBK0398253.1 ABC transporter substrate-binding protein [Thermohalobaculum xanthum]
MIGRIILAVQLAAWGLSVPAPAAERVVIAGGDLTEIAFALGAGDLVVGVDQTSTYPPAATELPQIGYMRRLSAEGVLSLAPDLVIAARDAGPDTVLEQLSAAGVPVSRAPDAEGPDSIAVKIRFVGDALGEEERAGALATRIKADLETIASRVALLQSRPRVLFVLMVRDGTPMVAGSGTAADQMLRLAGAENAATGFGGYKPMSREAIISAAPEAVIMMTSHADAAGGIDAVLSRPDLALTPAGRERLGVTMEGNLLLGFGPRTPEAVDLLARALHPATALLAAGFR